MKIKGKGQSGTMPETTRPDGGGDDVFQAWIKQQAQMQRGELGDGRGKGLSGERPAGQLLEIDFGQKRNCFSGSILINREVAGVLGGGVEKSRLLQSL